MLSDWIIEQTSDALIYASRDGTIERWNHAASQLFGFTNDEAVGQSLELIIPEHLRAPHWKGFDAAIASGNTRLGGHPTLTRAVRKDGQKLYVEMSFALVRDDAQQVIGSVAIARNVTERVEREKAAKAAAPKPNV